MDKDERIRELTRGTEFIKRGIDRVLVPDVEASFLRATKNLDSIFPSIEASQMPEYQEAVDALRATKEAITKYRDALVKRVDYLNKESVEEIMSE